MFSLDVLVSAGRSGGSVQWEVCSGTQTFNRKLFAAGEYWGLVSLAVTWHVRAGRLKMVYDSARVLAGRQYFKDVLVDGQSHLLIIREETELPGAQVRWKTSWCHSGLFVHPLLLYFEGSSPPLSPPLFSSSPLLSSPLLSSLQFTSWVDAVILVFSLENEASFQEVYKIYHQLAAHRPISEIPFVVVGTQGSARERFLTWRCLWRLLHLWAAVVFLDKISSTNPRVIDDARARQLCSDVRRCTYYETCATYGLNVNRVFNDGMCDCKSTAEEAANGSGMC